MGISFALPVAGVFRIGAAWPPLAAGAALAACKGEALRRTCARSRLICWRFWRWCSHTGGADRLPLALAVMGLVLTAPALCLVSAGPVSVPWRWPWW